MTSQPKSRKRNAVLQSLKSCRDYSPAFGFSHLMAFLYIAENPGIRITDLAAVTGWNVATASRVARALTSREADGSLNPALGLVSVTPDADRENWRVLDLTDAGLQLRDEVDRIIGSAVQIVE